MSGGGGYGRKLPVTPVDTSIDLNDPRSISPGGPRMISRNADGKFEAYNSPSADGYTNGAFGRQQDVSGQMGSYINQERRPSAIADPALHHRRRPSRGEVGDLGGRSGNDSSGNMSPNLGSGNASPSAARPPPRAFERRPSAGNVLYRTQNQRTGDASYAHARGGSASSSSSSSNTYTETPGSATPGGASFEDMLNDLEITRTSLPAMSRGRSNPGIQMKTVETLYQTRDKSRDQRSAAASAASPVPTASPLSQPGMLADNYAAVASPALALGRDMSRKAGSSGPQAASATAVATPNLAKATDAMEALLKDLDTALLNGNFQDSDPVPATSTAAASTASSLSRSESFSSTGRRPTKSTFASMGRPTANVQIQSQTSPTITAATPTTPVLRSATSSNSLPSADNSLTLGQQIVRKEQERREAERLAKEQAEKERVEQEKLEKEKLEAEERGRIEEERRKEERKDRERRERERREMERKMLEREDAERREREMERLGYEGAKVAEEEGIDERVVVPDYVHGLMRTLKSDQTLSPTPEDFSSPEGYSLWQRSMGISLQEVLCDLLKVRFLDPPPSKPSRPSASGTVDIFFKIVEARGLHAKEGRTRDAYCKIEIGDIADPAVASTPSGGSNAHRGNTEVYMTEVVKQSLSPVWNQHLEVSGRKPGDWIVVSVWDVRKDYFLGLMRIRVDDIMEKCSTDGFYGRWFRLEARGGKNKDKYVGGEILIEINVQMQQESSMDAPLSPIGNIQSHLLSSKISFKALYRTLLRSCLDLDMFALGSITEATSELLSSESRTCLRIWARTWLVGDAFQVVAYLELLFMRYQSYRVPVRALLNAYEAVYANMKQSGDWLTEYDKPALVQVLEEMQTYYRQQVSHYQEFYAKNKPDEALESTVLMLRMIHKNPIYREIHPDLPTSFRVEIETIMNEASRDRFQKLQQLAAPLDENDVEAVVEGLTKLTELLTEDVITDARYFRQPFENEVDIVRLTAESYVSNLVQTFEANASLFAGEEVVKVAGKEMFGLYTKLKTFDERLDKAMYVKDKRTGKMVSTIKKVASYPNFNIERWFAPFVSNWLENLSTQTLDWVNNAVKVDAFDVVVGHREDEANPPHSSSVTDLFTAVFQELEFVAALRWRNEVQSAAFFQKFAKTMNKAVEQYCDAIGTGELKAAESATTGSTWSSLLQTASSKQQQSNAPKDITNESCVKLCNVEFALRKLDDMYIRMNVATLARTMKDYRATLHPPKPQASTSPTSAFAADDHTIKGAFKLQLSYAENIKPVTNAGLASAYLVVRVPEGTLVPPPEIDDPVANVASVGQSLLRSISSSSRPLSGNASPVSTTTSSKTPIVLTGSLCEIARTRVVHDTLNPSWDETFTTLLPPVTHLEVLVYSRNLLTADELCGKAFMEFDPSKSRLRRKLADHLTHDVFLDLEPQGRVLIRMTLEGEEEDVDFWFRRSRERLLRTRDDFVRALNNKISPYLKEVILKSLKEHEAAPVPSKSFFTPLLSTVQLSNVTAQGASIDQSVTSSEADTQLAPLTDYLNKNLEILIASLSTTMAQEVIKRVWDETLTTVERSLIPPLFGQLEKDRRWLNRRQVSMAEWAIRILKDFFHADGHELGLPLKTLENRRYADLSALVAGYHADLPRLRREYEMRKEKELILRLVRLRIEKQEDLTQGEREEGRKWIETQLMSRKEKK